MYHRGGKIGRNDACLYFSYLIYFKRRREVVILATFFVSPSVDGQFHGHFDGQRRNGLAEDWRFISDDPRCFITSV